MLRITIELIPFGKEENKETIGVAEIFNNATGTELIGNYCMRIFRGNSRAIWKTTPIKNFPRTRLTMWDLLYRGLHKILGKRNTK